MRNLLPILAVAASAAALAAGAHADPCHLTDLRWMAGVWRADAAGASSEERWVVAPGDRLMGSSWDLHADRPGGVVEAETIVGDGGAIRLRVRHFGPGLDQPWEALSSPMSFVAASCGPQSVFFDGEDAHAGEHINYRRAGDTLTFTGDFLHDGKPVEVVIHFTRRGE
jgi:hypothetical protein